MPAARAPAALHRQRCCPRRARQGGGGCAQSNGPLFASARNGPWLQQRSLVGGVFKFGGLDVILMVRSEAEGRASRTMRPPRGHLLGPPSPFETALCASSG